MTKFQTLIFKDRNAKTRRIGVRLRTKHRLPKRPHTWSFSSGSMGNVFKFGEPAPREVWELTVNGATYALAEPPIMNYPRFPRLYRAYWYVRAVLEGRDV